MPAITSRENQTVKLLKRLLSSRRARCESGLFVVEGARLVAEAAINKIVIQTLLVTPRGMRLLGEEGFAVASVAGQYLVIEEELASKISDTQSPQGVFAICEGRLADHALPATADGGCLVLDSLQDPGNVGTILRSADAFGLSMVILSPDCPDPTAPKVLRASMGAAFRIPMAIADSRRAIDFLKSKNIPVYAAAISKCGGVIGDFSLGQSAVVIGNEGAGLSLDLIARCDQTITIPIVSGCESLNAAMAATIFCYEMSRAAGGMSR